jgi:hypothetical protein
MKFVIGRLRIIFHYKDVFMFEFQKLAFGGKDPLKLKILELVPSGGIDYCELPQLALLLPRM